MEDFKIGFGSDNHSGVHPEMFRSLADVNTGHAPSYGTDPVSLRALTQLRRHFGENCEAFFVFNGTAANVLSLRAMVDTYQSVLCAQSSHLNVDECGAPERLVGCKLIPIPTADGKITVEAAAEHLVRRGDQHCSQPRVISVTQPTELGTTYSLSELRTIAEFARREGLLFHMDGARLVNAAAFLGVSLKELTADIGVDVLSFGGTKNGLMFGEAVVFFKPDLARNFKYYRKQNLQLPSKTRFIAAQFEAWLKDDLWLKIASHANHMAQRLRKGLEQFSFIEITQPTESNAVFAKIPKSLITPLRDRYFFYVWDENTFEVRLMTSFDTQPANVDGFVDHLRELSLREGLGK